MVGIRTKPLHQIYGEIQIKCISPYIYSFFFSMLVGVRIITKITNNIFLKKKLKGE